MHVAQFVHRYPPALGGAEAWTQRLGHHLRDAGHEVSVWTTTALDLTAFTKTGKREVPTGLTTEHGINVRRYAPSFRWPGRRYLMKAASLIPIRSWQALTQHWSPTVPGMWKDIRRESREPDVVHALAFPHGSIIRCALQLARDWEVPFVITPFLHLGDPDDPHDPIRHAYTAPYLRWLLKRASRVLVQTPTEERAVREMGISADRIRLQGLGVEPAECIGGKRERARVAWGIQPREVVIGHLANLSVEKGTPDLLAAAAELHKAGVPIRVVLAGPVMPALGAKLASPEPWLTRLGSISDEQRRDFYAGIDLFALPSRSDSFGLVFLEAWANGVPVIGYRAGGVVDVIRHKVDGLLVKCGDIDGLAAALRQLAVEPSLREKWGRAGRDRLERDFRWEDKLEIARTALTEW